VCENYGTRLTVQDTTAAIGETVRAVTDVGGLSGAASSVLTAGDGTLKLLIPTSLVAAIRN